MKPLHLMILAAAIVLGAAGMYAWQQEDGPAENFGEQIDEGAEEIRDEIDDAS